MNVSLKRILNWITSKEIVLSHRLCGSVSNTAYDLSYTDNGNNVGPQNETTNASGEILLGNLPQGAYGDFTVTNANGCSASAPNTINLNDQGGPSVTAPNDVEICIGQSVTLTATNPDGATITWDISINDGVAFTPTSSGTTVYTVTATDVNNCSATDNVSVIVHNLPSIDAGQDQSICNGESTTLSASGAGAGGNYVWDQNVTNGSPFIPTATATYEVTGTDANGCVNTDQVEVTVNENPVPDFEGDNLRGCEPLIVNFTNNTGLTGATCYWEFGDGNTSSLCDNVSNTYASSGLYSVTLTVTDANGCSGTYTAQDYIEVTPKPDALFTADPMVSGTSNPEVNFTNETQNGTDFTWIFGDGSPAEYTFNATHTFPDDKDGEYIVTLIASNGPDCNDTAKAVIKIEEDLIFYIPNSFTPDKDNFNETFKPIFTSGFDSQTYTLTIYNRWGEIIFESHNTNVGWNGTYGENSTRIVKQGTYVWKIKVKETGKDKHNTYTGHVNLLK